VTTNAAYQSQAPPGWTLAKSTDSYRLWRRTATTPPIAILYEEARPGRVYRCKNSKLGAFLSAGGQLLTWQPRPVIAKRLYWKRGGQVDNKLAPGEEASQTISLPPGQWWLSLQYVSPVTGVEVTAPGEDAHLPAGVDAAIPYRPDQGPYWPIGKVTSNGERITFTVKADQVDTLQKILGVDAEAVIGNLTAVRVGGFKTVPNDLAACGLYVDHIIGGRQLRNTASGGK
jgi:hypothetical protein